MVLRTIYHLLTFSLVIGGVHAATPKIAPPPDRLAGLRTWESNAEGYIYSIGYFTDTEIQDDRWEQKRLQMRDTATICENDRVVQRDVRWYEPTAESLTRCALVVYSVACPIRKPAWGSSLKYDRDQILLGDPPSTIEANCGEKDYSKIAGDGETREAENKAREAAARLSQVSDAVSCDEDTSQTTGLITIVPGARISLVTKVSRNFNEIFPGWRYDYPKVILERAATYGQKAHAIFTKDELPDDGQNIFIEQSFARSRDGHGYCVTLLARQGRSIWQRTVLRSHILDVNAGERDNYGHPREPKSFWTPNTDIHELSHQLALSMDLPLPPEHIIRRQK